MPQTPARPTQDTALLDQARQQYPILNNVDMHYKYSPEKHSAKSGYLEFYPPDEIGTPAMPRPFPTGKIGVEVYNPQTRPIDILGDVTSHHLVNGADPKLTQLYQQFSQSLDPAMMQRRYAHAQANEGESRPFADWAKASGIPGMFRGYTFDQWPNAARMYTPQQLQILDQVRTHVGIAPAMKTLPRQGAQFSGR